MVIYIVVNLVNGKVYVGQTRKSVDVRWRLHIKAATSGSPFPIHSAIRKYGMECFGVYLVSDATSQEDLDLMEDYFISRYGSLAPNGYNRCRGGLGFKGVHTPESRERMRISHVGKVLPLQQKIKISEAAKKQWATPGFKNPGRTGKATTPETRMRISEAIKTHWEKRRSAA
jgi:group I intron endonuclease